MEEQMRDRTFGIKAQRSSGRAFICFGRIRRDPLTMRLVLDAIESGIEAAGAVIDDDELFSALERLMVAAPKKAGTSMCGPMFWPFKKAVEHAIGQLGTG